MRVSKRLLAIVVVTLCAGLIARFPARVAYHWLGSSEIRLAGIDGTVWRGSAAEGQTSGIYIRNITWVFKPLSLLVGKVAFSASMDPASGFLTADVSAGLNGNISFANLDAALPILALQNMVQAPGLDGAIKLSFDELTIKDGVPISADGTAELTNLFVRGLAPSSIGDFRAQFTTTDDGIVASVEDIAAIVDIAGTLRITPNRHYSLTGLIAPTSSTPTSVIDQLKFLGTPNERGQREFRFEGQL